MSGLIELGSDDGFTVFVTANICEMNYETGTGRAVIKMTGGHQTSFNCSRDQADQIKNILTRVTDPTSGIHASPPPRTAPGLAGIF